MSNKNGIMCGVYNITKRFYQLIILPTHISLHSINQSEISLGRYPKREQSDLYKQHIAQFFHFNVSVKSNIII